MAGSDDDFDPKANGLEKMKKKIMGGKTRKIELDSDLAINDDQVSLEIQEKKPKRERK